MIARLTVVLSMVIAFAGCSNQWRDADANITAAEMMEMLNSVTSSSNASSGDLSQALALKDDPNAAIYFADAPDSVGGMGSVASIASLVDWSFLGQDYATLSIWKINEVRVFFIDAPQADGSRKTALILGLKIESSANFTYFGFTGTASLGDNDYSTVLSAGGQVKLILKSLDAEDGDLEPVIQLKAYSPGDEEIGKFSTLVGFGP
jgi:hypothetical protein